MKEEDAKEGTIPKPRGKGFAFVWMWTKKEAERAMEGANGAVVKAGMAGELVRDKQVRKKDRRKTKKKAKDDGGAPRPSQDSESSMHFRPFQKKKKAPEPEKVDIDLSSALPSNDDFRTSLLMLTSAKGRHSVP